MSPTIHCLKLQKEAEGLDTPPFPTPLGKKIYENISKEAWQDWVKHQIILINENRLNLSDAKSQKFITKEMEKFLFGEGSEKPEGYIPTPSDPENANKS